MFLDGGMGTLLQDRGLKGGEFPEIWNIEKPEEIIQIHKQYVEAGSDIILTNTFGANGLKFQNGEYQVSAIVKAAIKNAKAAQSPYIGLDVGPTGKLLKPLGDLSFEDAYRAFQEVMVIGEEEGVDLIHIETMSDLYETKAAVLAAKENTKLPVFVTMIFDENGKLLTGGDVPGAVAMLEGLRVDALGINCAMGPAHMIPILEELLKYSSKPVIVKPNAGLPRQKDGEVYYDVGPEEFGDYMEKISRMGAGIVGGCCGTTPKHIKKMVESCKTVPFEAVKNKDYTIVSSYGKALILTDDPVIIGERINPTGKKKLKEALVAKDYDYILKEALAQEEAGAHILDVNVGLPEIDEEETMIHLVREIQSITSLPLQIDTVDLQAMESGLRAYNGKGMVNSVNGKQASMDEVFPLVAKYGGVVLGLTLDENGIPDTSEGRVEIAGRIIEEAKKYGIDKKDIIIDVLAMTISSEPKGACIVLEGIREVKKRFGVKTALGVSNISFGLPNRGKINSNFYACALEAGLNAGIINPGTKEMMDTYFSYRALAGYDKNCLDYIGYTGKEMEPKEKAGRDIFSLKAAIEKGLKDEASQLTRKLLKDKKPLDIVNEDLMPALDVVGKGFEEGSIFLPQLLMSADAAKQAFGLLQDEIKKTGEEKEAKDKVIVATVKGDIHDIGKNIVKVLLENYGFDVIDLGKDVLPSRIVEEAVRQEVKLVGLSALMTTTVVSMEETIKQLKEAKPDCKVMVGGAVLNQEYADQMCADFYGKDAMQSVRYAKQLFKNLED
nr:homocysteine S-methyltransferase family protein [Aequitasia blattaphilus]